VRKDGDSDRPAGIDPRVTGVKKNDLLEIVEQIQAINDQSVLLEMPADNADKHAHPRNNLKTIASLVSSRKAGYELNFQRPGGGERCGYDHS
jgi:hypothetical protein